MRIAAIWIGHVRTFHRVWPDNIIQRFWSRLPASEPIRSFFYTYPGGQCRRNRPDDPPADYSSDEALEYVRLALKPQFMEIKDRSQRSLDLYDKVVRARPDMNVGHVGTVVHQFTKRLEAWEDFKVRMPDWADHDAIVFHRPDVEFCEDVDIKLPVSKDEYYTFASLGPPYFYDGVDDRFAIGHPLAIDRYMRMGESVESLLIDQRRDWWPEQNYARHCERSGIKRLEALYTTPTNQNRLEIVRFKPDDGRVLSRMLDEVRGLV